MPILHRCPHCKQKLNIPDRKAGQDVNCPACKNPFTVPQPETESKKEAEAIFVAETVAEKSTSEKPTPKKQEEEDEDFAIRSPSTDFEEMDLTPMVDVTFLLLIFFMITASFTLQKTIQVPPPDPDEQGASQSVQTLDDLQEESIIVQIDEENAIIVDDDPVGDTSELEELFQDKMVTEDKNELVIEAHQNAFHEMIVAVVDAGNGAGVQKIRLVTRSGDD